MTATSPSLGWSRLLVANRGEIAVRVLRAARELGVATVAVHAADDPEAVHLAEADDVVALDGTGVAPFLDVDGIVAAATGAGADAIHPGYGFLAESAVLARAADAAGLVFVGPDPATLDTFGDKVAARRAATAAGVPVLAGSDGPTTIDDARALLAQHGAIMVKAVAGGGGRGMRAVTDIDDLDAAWERCRSEATTAFGSGDLYVERLVALARHIEVQIVGDGIDVVHLGTRDCSLQRRNQKLIEIAPAPDLAPAIDAALGEAAVAVGRAVGYRGVATVEFLVEAEGSGFWFIETNARIQVEHTVTEEVTGVDLVEAQLRLAGGATLADLGLDPAPRPRGWAIQARVNAETLLAGGATRPSVGTVSAVQLPAGAGIRVDAALAPGMAVTGAYDPLVAKVIVHRRSGSFDQARAKLHRAIGATAISGLATNLDVLAALTTDGRYLPATTSTLAAALAEVVPDGPAEDAPTESAGLTDGLVTLVSPLQGTVVSVEVAAGEAVRAGQLVAVVEAMKMEHEITAPTAGTIDRVDAAVGQVVSAGATMAFLVEGDGGDADAADDGEVDLDEIRPSLAEMLALRHRMMDEARPEAVARRRASDQRTARENLADLVDDGTFVEYGPMALAAQRRRRGWEDLIDRSPADGLITGVGSINGDRFAEPDNRCAVMIYDYTVFAGTQGIRNHAKTDRIIDVAAEGRMPLVLFAEGGGGRPGDTDGGDFGSRTFSRFATLSGLVPMVGVVSGYCFAGNASLLGCCDVIIATRNANIGMGGPAMIEGGGLGVFDPDEIGPVEVQTANGVIDVLVDDEAEATEVAKRYLAYFQGPVPDWEAADQRLLRRAVPENRLRSYDIRSLIETLADVGSVLELRRDFGHGMVTALIRIEGRPLGLVANDPHHLGGAIDADAGDKAARFLQLCDAHDLPVLFLCDTPGIMVGPDAERTALVRHANRLFLIGANLEVPTFTVVVRKAYGLGGIAMAGGSFKVPVFSVGWPTAEFGPMGLEGSVKLGFRAELAAIEDPDERQARYDELVAKEYKRGKALNHATGFAIDDTIDPADTRHWLVNSLASLRPPPPRATKKRSAIDGW